MVGVMRLDEMRARLRELAHDIRNKLTPVLFRLDEHGETDAYAAAIAILEYATEIGTLAVPPVAVLEVAGAGRRAFRIGRRFHVTVDGEGLELVRFDDAPPGAPSTEVRVTLSREELGALLDALEPGDVDDGDRARCPAVGATDRRWRTRVFRLDEVEKQLIDEAIAFQCRSLPKTGREFAMWAGSLGRKLGVA